ncbi:MAG TPA: hypothetical protein VM680_09615 [Verrucomicrobiae bacterium]|nr:hypothetical protein [Verrucomicrobiae bacterium]
MTSRLRGRVGWLGVLLVGTAFVIWAIAMLSREARERRAILKPLLSRNAPLSDVRAQAGEFAIWRRGTPTWDQVFAKYERGSEWDRHIASKMKNAAAVGHTSTISMQTWIFLNQEDRLIDFELGSQ